MLMRMGHSAPSRSRSVKPCSRRRRRRRRDAVSTIFVAVRNVVGGVFGLVTLLLLTFYMLVDSREIFSFFVRLFPARATRARRRDQRRRAGKVSAWLGGQLLLA